MCVILLLYSNIKLGGVGQLAKEKNLLFEDYKNGLLLSSTCTTFSTTFGWDDRLEDINLN